MAAYDTAGNIISDAAVELGLGKIGDPYGSSDANVIQLRGLLKSAGRKLVFDRDWNHLTREYSFVTLPNWKANTGYGTENNVDPWTTNFAVDVGSIVTNQGNFYRCIASVSPGLTASSGPGPSSNAASVPDGDVTWAFQNVGTASIVVKGQYQYTCTTGFGLSGTNGPTGGVLGATEVDGTVTWQNTGLASDYALPGGFSNMIDQTGWNRTSRLPLGGPIDGQSWQYLKGRQQGIVFNVLFRDVAGTFRLYPDTDPPGGYNIAFEYVTSYWASPTGGTAPTQDAPTLNSDLVYFDPLLMTRKLKLDWLRNKGFDSSAAQAEYEDILESVMNADGSGRVLNMRGAGMQEPLLGVANLPFTGLGQ